MRAPRRHSRRRAGGPARTRGGLTLVELVIAMAIAAMAAALAIGALNSLTNQSLHSTAVELTGAIKFCYDRAIMERRTERLSIDIDKGLWWIDYTQDMFAISSERVEGKEGDKTDSDEKSGGAAKKKKTKLKDSDSTSKDTKSGKGPKDLLAPKTPAEPKETKSIFDEDSSSGSKDKDQAKKDEVKLAIEGGKAIEFQPDSDVSKPKPFPSDVKVSRVWAGHQVEAFTSGIARIHFFNTGWSEPAQIELTDGSEFVTLKIYPLTGRVRTYPKQLEIPKSDLEDGKEEDKEW
jgi:prepilin-type N-terminal cleavage/methylation domain-containing protein